MPTLAALFATLALQGAAPATPAAQATPATQATPPARTPDLATVLPLERTMPVDPVILQRGTVAAGDPRISLVWEGNAYLFASEDTREIFRNDPFKYAAQDGGACGRMGPLGGLGDARRYGLQDGLLYFFASDDCLKSFRVEPKKYMEPQDILPVGSPEQQEAGLAAIDRWVAWAGGKAAIKAAATYSQTSTRRVNQGKDQWDVTEALEIAGPRTMRRIDTWRKVGGAATDVHVYVMEATPERATITSSNGKVTELAPSRRKAFERTMNRLPYAILRARYRPEAGFLAIKTGEGTLGGAACDYVQTWFEGNSTYLAIDKATGRLVQEGHIGRDESLRVSPLTLDVVAEAGPEALRLPTQWVTSRTGEKEGTKGPVAAITVGPARPAPAPAQPSQLPQAPTPR